MTDKPRYRRVLLKASGEALMGGQGFGIDVSVADRIAADIAAARALGVEAVVLSAIAMPELCESFSQRQATAYIDGGKVVLFAGGTGNPFFTTDTAAALRAAEIGADALFKATQVDGVYSADPKRDAQARRFDRITHEEVLTRGLAIMDTAAIALARENHIPIIVYSIQEQGGFSAILKGGGRCTVVADA